MRGFLRAAKQRRKEARVRGEVPQPGRMWSFRPGLQRLIEALTEQLPRPPFFGVRVSQIERGTESWVMHGEDSERWTADAVVLACPAGEQARMLAELDPALAEEIAAIPYNRIAVVAVAYRQSDVTSVPDGFGYIAPQRTRRDLLGVQWCSAIYPDRAPQGCVLWRALCGGWRRTDVVDWDDDRLLAAVRAELRLALGVTATPIFHHIHRWPLAIPQYHVGHQERVSRIEGRAAHHAGLFLAGNAYHGVALNDCTEQAEILSGKIESFLATRAGGG
jgi:oxygen-dependent protoporphyrinogen oxidase